MQITAPDYPIPTQGKVLYVSPNGSDITGDGTRDNPYFSIKVAYAAVPITPDKWFIVALDGVYSLTRIENAGATIAWTGLATGSFAFKTGLVFGNDLSSQSSTRSKNVCLMSENIGGCKLIGSAEIPLDYEIGGLAVYNRGIGRSSLADYYIYTQELETPLTVKDDPSTLTYPAMLNRPEGPTPPEFFVAGTNQFTIPALNGFAATQDIHGVVFRCVSTSTWTATSNAGITIFKINLDRGGRHITDLITAETIKFPDIIWEDTTFLWHNGNNVVQFSKLARVDFVEGVCTAVYSDILVGGNIVGLALIGNKKFITKVGQYGTEITPISHKIYYKPREATAPATIRYPAITTAFVSGNVNNLEVTGFEIGEFETSAWMAFSQPSSLNNKLKYNIIRDPRGVGVDVGRGVDYEIHGNLFMRCGRRCIQAANNAANLPVLQNVRITNNTLLFWRERAGIYTQAIRGIHIEGNYLTTLYSQHADVIAVYEGSTDCTITKNFAYTPYDIGVRIQEYTKGYYEISNNIFYSDPGLIIDRVQGSLSQAPSPLAFQRESEKATFNVHHNYISHSGGKPNMAQDIWWGIYNRKIRYNILASSNDALDRVNTGLIQGQNGSYIVLNFLQGTGAAAALSVTMPELYQSAYERLLPAAYNGTNPPSVYASWVAGRIVPADANGVTMEQFPSGHYAWSYDATTPNWDGTPWDGLPRVYNNILLSRNNGSDRVTLVDNSITITPGSAGSTNAIPLVETNTILASEIIYASAVAMKDRVEALAAGTRDATGINGFYDFRSNLNLDPDELIGPDWVGPPVTPEGGDYLSWWVMSAGLNVGDTTTSNPDPDNTPIDNHPITVALTTTDVIFGAYDWDFKDNTTATRHGADSFFVTSGITQVPNYLNDIPLFTDPNRDNPGIGPSRSNEQNGDDELIGTQGGVYVNGSNMDFTLDPTVGNRNTLNINTIATKFMQEARVLGGVTMNLILHGKSVPSEAFAEYRYVAAEPDDGSGNQVDPNLSGTHFSDFYRKYAYIAFNSREVPVQSITSNQISFRKGFHHGFTKWSKADLAGLSLSNGATGVSQIHAMNLSLWNTPHGLSFGALCTFDTLTTPVNETATAINTTNVPTSISCTKKTLRFVGIQNLTAHFQAVSNKEFSLFSTLTFNHNGKIIASDPLFGFDDPNPVYTLTNQSSLSIRTQYAHTHGNKNLLGIKFASGATRLSDGTSNIGIVVGSYIRISGSSATSNNGIYQVLSIQNGIPNDINENTSLADGLSPFSYLELSRAITPTAEGNSILIENVSHLPILHLRYRTP